jgi:hypothetical protein
VSSSITSAISSSAHGIATINGTPIGGSGGATPPATVDAPLPEWALTLLAVLLFLSVTWSQRRHQ